jgi:aryl-alcohol dehydrogenase
MKTRTVAAVVDHLNAPFVLQEVDLDEPRADEVLVRMVATGLCHTDLSAQVGIVPFPLPGVLGHEGAGVVESIGAGVTRVVPGDHVLASFSSCGHCIECRAGHSSLCGSFHPLNLSAGTRADGTHTIYRGAEPLSGHFFGQSSLARHAIIDERSLVKVPEHAPLQLLAPLGCGIQTGAGAVLNVLRPEPGCTLAVFGIGAVGCAAIMAAALSGAAQIVAVDVVAARLELARELGATDTIDASQEDPVTALLALSGGPGVDYAIEASGNVAVLSQAMRVLAPRGTCAILGTYGPGVTVPLEADYMLDGRRVIGVSEGDSDPATFIPALVRLHELGKLPLEKLIRHYPFEQIEQAAADARAGKTIKPVLLFD